MRLHEERSFWTRAIRRGWALAVFRIRCGLVLALEASCDFLDDFPRISRVPDPEKLGSLWRIERGRYGCRWFQLVALSKKLDSLWATNCWSDE